MHVTQNAAHIYAAQHLLAAVRMLAARKQIDVRQGADVIEAKLEAACLAAFRVAADAGHAHAADKLDAVLQTPLVMLLTRAYYSGYTLGSVALKAAELRTARRTPVAKKVTSAQRQAAAWAEQHAAETIKGITETTRDEIRFIIARLLDQDVSLTSKEARDLIAKAVGDKRRAQLIARTEVMRAVHEGQRQSWKDAADRGDISARVRRRWITADDEATCPICLPLDKKRATLDGTYPGGFEGPPAHPNSIVAGVVVEGDTIAATRMSYAGQVREIVTAAGRTLTITPGHRVATLRGFIPARDVNERDYLLSYKERIEVNRIDISASQSSPVLPQDEQHRPSAIEQVFSTLQLTGKLVITERLGTEFHGDAAYGNGDIDVVYADIELGLRCEATFLDQRERFRLKAPGRPTAALRTLGHIFDGLLVADRAFVPTLRGFVEHSFEGGVGTVAQRDTSFDETRTEPTAGVATLDRECQQGLAVLVSDDQCINDGIGNWDSAKPHTVKVGTTSHLDAVLLELLRKSLTRDAGFVRQLEERLAGQITRDQIVKIRDVDYFGHVYDLSTVSGVIVAESLIISNCRCTEQIA